MTWIPSSHDIRQAARRIEPFIHRTPVLTSQSTDDLLQAHFFFKCENFQKVGAFKMRGAANAVLQLPDSEKESGVATHSSGNHAQALARAAKKANIPAHIVMPCNAPRVKVEAVQAYGAEITFCEPNLQAREEKLDEVVEKTGATFIHPFNNKEVITGQATAAFELFEQAGPLDYIMAPVGGGGLLSGTLAAALHFGNSCQVVAAEPEGADDAFRSLQAGRLIPMEEPDTIADGLLTSLGDLTFPIIQQYVEAIWTVSDDMIIQALKWVYERLKIIIEPSCAVPLAAAMEQKQKLRGKRVGIILTGGNIDLKKLACYFR